MKKAILILAVLAYAAGCASSGQKYMVVSASEEVRSVHAGEVFTNTVDGVVVPWGVWVRMREAAKARIVQEGQAQAQQTGK